ncbi:hypothetical protein NDA01_21565 [Trichocoleus desertorum AS-A10]|uniref:hypothetical protein n=1 Tax=Trichocoleus desertorum TaxID=1481672 RepID=UPI0032998D41
MRLFSLHLKLQHVDHTIKVAEGVQFPNGWCSLSMKIATRPYHYESIADLERVHCGEGNKVKLVWY